MNPLFTSPEHEQRLVSVLRLIGKVDSGKADPEYASALYILTADNDTWSRVEPYVTRDGINVPTMLKKEHFSGGYGVLMRLAGNLFNGRAHVEPLDLMRLDDGNFQIALSAIQLRREGLFIVPVQEPEKSLETIEADIRQLLSTLPESYPPAEFKRDADGTYSLRIDYTSIFGSGYAAEALERVKRYVKERERNPTLPIGVIDGIYD